MLPIRSILVPTDFSDHSRAALHLAAALARDHNAHMIVLHVRENPVAPFMPYGKAPPQHETEQTVLNDQFVDFKLANQPLQAEYVVVSGVPAEEIVRAAVERQCDLIVMATHGRTGLGRLMLGSVAEEVMRMAPCGVLTLKQPLPAAETLQAGPEPKPESPRKRGPGRS
jgi:nucleotide-binding universal stress UspA family protein